MSNSKSNNKKIKIGQMNILNNDLSKNPLEYTDPTLRFDLVKFLNSIKEYEDINSFIANNQDDYIKFINSIVFIMSEMFISSEPKVDFHDAIQIDKKNQNNLYEISKNLSFLKLLNFNEKQSKKIISSILRIYNINIVNYKIKNNSGRLDLIKKDNIENIHDLIKLFKTGRKEIENLKLGKLEKDLRQNNRAFYSEDEKYNSNSNFQKLLTINEESDPIEFLNEKTEQEKNEQINSRLLYYIYDLIRQKIIQASIIMAKDLQSSLHKKLSKEKILNENQQSSYIKSMYDSINKLDISAQLFDKQQCLKNLYSVHDETKDMYINQLKYNNQKNKEINSNQYKIKKIMEKTKIDKDNGIEILILNEINSEMFKLLQSQEKQKLFKIAIHEEIKKAFDNRSTSMTTVVLMKQNEFETVADELEKFSDDFRNYKIRIRRKTDDFKLCLFCLHLDSKNAESRILMMEPFKEVMKVWMNTSSINHFVIAGDINENFFEEKSNDRSVYGILYKYENLRGHLQEYENCFKDKKTTSKLRSGMQAQIDKIHKYDNSFKDIIFANTKDFNKIDKDHKSDYIEMLEISDHALTMIQQTFQ